VYDPYGKATVYDGTWTNTVSWGNSHKNALRFCGYRYDGLTGLYHVRRRGYHPALGRWLQRDPGGFVDGMSLYLYVHCSPAGGSDPFGTDDSTTTQPTTRPTVEVVGKPLMLRDPWKVRWGKVHIPYYHAMLQILLGSRSQWCYRMVDYEVHVREIWRISVAGQNIHGQWDSGTVVQWSTLTWQNPSQQLVETGLRGPDGRWNPDNKKYACRIRVKCRAKCRCGVHKWETEWRPDDRWVLGTLYWDHLAGVCCESILKWDFATELHCPDFVARRECRKSWKDRK